MRIIRICFLLSLLLAATFCHGQDKNTVEVVGVGECVDCKETNINTAHALSGLKVNIDCKKAGGHFKTRGVGELDSEGNFKVSLPEEIVDDGKLKEECYAQLQSASEAPCPAHEGLESSKIEFKSKSDDGKHILGLPGNLKFSPALCTSAFLWPHFKYPYLPKLKLPLKKFFPHVKDFGHKPFTFPPKVFPKFPPKIPIHKKPFPPKVPILKKPLPPKVSVPIYKKPLPPPIYKKPIPPPVPIYKKPIPPPVPIYKKPLPPPIYKKPIPPPVPIYKKPIPPPVPIYKKPIPPPVPIYKKPIPPPVPVYNKPLPPPVPIHKKPILPPVPIHKKPIPPFPKFPKKPLPPLPKLPHFPKIDKKKPCPPLPELPPLPKFPPKDFHHPKFGKFPPLPPFVFKP